MIPKSSIGIELDTTESIETSRTYKLLDNKIQGYIDELEAVRQAIYKVLNTEKYEYPIYSFNYGIELESLIGKDPVYVQIELKRRVQECLLQDERIKSVDNFKFEINGDKLLCTFDVTSIYGDLTITKEVTI
ncbi:Protein of unknown function [Caloranaerobacter azorensis DSM 13643]|uniref:DUF2634 domain-containing protein n=1 Tax=Caloranaerobacter azorensis DSM 13643 TaxID=1121264 RepID=A0A1M5VLV2_9FIRM|nr:DUF2634 domain-containing protein [Caloranaerobacter azorensis]SHH76219.1 Protein of unknown function [Caloranaerobacter azorensis DSM 13643]